MKATVTISLRQFDRFRAQEDVIKKIETSNEYHTIYVEKILAEAEHEIFSSVCQLLTKDDAITALNQDRDRELKKQEQYYYKEIALLQAELNLLKTKSSLIKQLWNICTRFCKFKSS